MMLSKLCCAARDGKAQRYTAAVPSSDESQTNAVAQLPFPLAEAEGLEGSVQVSGRGIDELSSVSDRESGSDRASKGRGRIVSPRSIILGAARRLTGRSSRRGSDDSSRRTTEASARKNSDRSRVLSFFKGEAAPRESEEILPPIAFHDALIAGWLDCVPVPPGQSQLLGVDAYIEAPKAKSFNRRWAAVWHDRVAWYDGGRETASLQLTHATVVAAVAGNGACLACLSGEHGVYLSFSDEAEAKTWAGHIRSATVPLLAEHEELERAEVAPIRMCIIRALYNMQHMRARTHERTPASRVYRMIIAARWSCCVLPAPIHQPIYPRRRNGRRRSRIRGVTGR